MMRSLLSSPFLSFTIVISALTLHAKIIRIKDVIKNDFVCKNENYRATADRLLQSMDQNKNPCDSFYEYACGNWAEGEPNVIAGLMTDNIKHKFEELFNVSPSSRNFLLTEMQKLYKSCIKIVHSTHEEMMTELLRAINANQEMPLLMTENEWLSKNKSWLEVDNYFRKFTGYSPFFIIDTFVPLYKNMSIHIQLNTINLSRREHQLFKNRLINFEEDFTMSPEFIEYKNELKNSQIFTEARKKFLTDHKLEKDIKDIIKFEWELERIKTRTTNTSVSGVTKQWITISFNEFRNKFQSILFETTNGKINLPRVIEQYYDVIPKFNLNGSENVQALLDYFSDLANLLNRTPSHVIVNTIYLDFIERLASIGSLMLKKLSSNVTEDNDGCISLVREYYPYLTDYLYLQRYSSNAIIKKIQNIMPNIKKGLESVISHSLISDVRKRSWYSRTKDLSTLIGYPMEYRNKTHFENFYQNLNMRESYFFNNILTTTAFDLNKKLELAGNRNEFLKSYRLDFSSLDFKLVYEMDQSNIFIPYGILQPPMVDIEQPEFTNYGGIGCAIGRELTHSLYGVDNPLFENGRKRKWLSSIENKHKCLIERYLNYSIVLKNTAHQMNSYKIVMNNIAEIIGVQISYRAFQVHKMYNTESRKRLPGLERFNSDQLFFLSYASTQCDSKDISKQVDDLKKYHMPNRFKVDGSLSNNEIFVKVFQCSKGTKMNPVEDCHLFDNLYPKDHYF